MINKIKVGAIDYDVELKEVIEVDNDTGYYGMCHHSEGLIEVSTRHSLQRQHQTLVHELLHAVMHESGLSHEMDDEEEERLVNRISIVLYQVMKENDLSFLYGKRL